MKKPIKAVFTCIGLALLFLLVQVTSGVVVGIYQAVKASIAGAELNPDDIQRTIEAQIHWIAIVNYSLTSIILFLAFIIKEVKIKEYVFFKKVAANKIPWLLCYAMGLQFISSYAIQGLNYLHPLDESYEQMAQMFEGNNKLMIFIALVIVAPIIEEILFRGIILTKLKNHLNVKAAIVIQAILFAVIHLNMVQLIPTFLMGIALGILYIKDKNIITPIMFHMFFNAYAVIANYFSEDIQAYLGYALAGAAVLSIINLTKSIRSNKEISPSKSNDLVG